MPINDVASATFSKTLLPLALLLLLLLLPLSAPVTAGVVASVSGAVVAGTAVVMVAVVSPPATTVSVVQRLHVVQVPGFSLVVGCRHQAAPPLYAGTATTV